MEEFSQSWNLRRWGLIARYYSGGLTKEERLELTELQERCNTLIAGLSVREEARWRVLIPVF